MGYDYLALNVLRNKGSISGFGNQIGVGKESNIYIVINEEEEDLCLKVHRLVIIIIIINEGGDQFIFPFQKIIK